MPPLATKLVDLQGLGAVRAWVEALGRTRLGLDAGLDVHDAGSDAGSDGGELTVEDDAGVLGVELDASLPEADAQTPRATTLH
jgi:hypothetical protein